jgi:hypothetical protein
MRARGFIGKVESMAFVMSSNNCSTLARAFPVNGFPLLIGLELHKVHLAVSLDRLGSIQNWRVGRVDQEHLGRLHEGALNALAVLLSFHHIFLVYHGL